MVVGIYEQSSNQNIDVVTTVDRNAIPATLFGYSVRSLLEMPRDGKGILFASVIV